MFTAFIANVYCLHYFNAVGFMLCVCVCDDEGRVSVCKCNLSPRQAMHFQTDQCCQNAQQTLPIAAASAHKLA